jgi:uncharacterized protein (TIGR03790 family)
MLPRAIRGFLIAAAAALCAHGQTAGQVLIVVNDESSLSRSIAAYYAQKRQVPAGNVCHIHVPPAEVISRSDYDRDIAAPIANCLRARGLIEKVYYVVTTAGIPFKIPGTTGPAGDYAAVDSELTLLYRDLSTGRPHPLSGPAANPFFGKRGQAFSHPQFPMYLVTRLAAYDLEGVKAMIDRSLHASNQGRFVIDLSAANDTQGNDWLRSAAILLPKARVVLDETSKPVYGETGVIGYASWGSNDPHRDRRFPGFHWLPGAIATEFVSTDGRTFQKPPERWTPGMDWNRPAGFFAGSPQSLAADLILEGATGASAHVDEPYLIMTPRPDYLFPAYYSGRNLAESYYLAIPALSWQNIVLGDPLCSLGKPGR